MGKNIMRFLGFLGLLGLLGLVTGNTGFYGFFGFFGFLSIFWGKGTDERVDRNIGRACRNSFVFAMAASAAFISLMATLEVDLFPVAFTALFAGGVAVFVGSFVYYNTRGD